MSQRENLDWSSLCLAAAATSSAASYHLCLAAQMNAGPERRPGGESCCFQAELAQLTLMSLWWSTWMGDALVGHGGWI